MMPKLLSAFKRANGSVRAPRYSAFRTSYSALPLLILATACFLGCVEVKPKPETLITGHWEAVDKPVSFDFDQNHTVSYDAPDKTGRGGWAMRNGEYLLQISELTAKSGGPAEVGDHSARGYINAEGALILKSADVETIFRRVKSSKFTIKPLGGGPEPTPLPRTGKDADAAAAAAVAAAAAAAAQAQTAPGAAAGIPQATGMPDVTPGQSGPLRRRTGGGSVLNRPRTVPLLVRPDEPAQDNAPQNQNMGNMNMPQQQGMGYPQQGMGNMNMPQQQGMGYPQQNMGNMNMPQQGMGYPQQGMGNMNMPQQQGMGYPQQQGMGDPQQDQDNPQQPGGNQP